MTARTRILGARSGLGDVVVVTGRAGDVPGPGGFGGPPSVSKGADGDLEQLGDVSRTVPSLQHCEGGDLDGVTPLRSSSLVFCDLCHC